MHSLLKPTTQYSLFLVVNQRELQQDCFRRLELKNNHQELIFLFSYHNMAISFKTSFITLIRTYGSLNLENSKSCKDYGSGKLTVSAEISKL